MYKVFLNDREINIGTKSNITLNQSTEIVDSLLTKKDVKKWFSGFSESGKSKILLVSENVEIFWKKCFKKAFKVIYAAGGVVVRDGQLLFIYRNDKWDLPKGKIDGNESPETAAIREVSEECGITGHSIIKSLPSTFHIYQSPYNESKGRWILKETFWFEMIYTGDENGMPQTEENISEVRWLKKNDLNIVLSNTYENLKQIILPYRF